MKKLSFLLALVLLLSCCAGMSALADETVTFTWMYPLGQGFQVVDNMSENATIKRANKANNVEIIFQHPPVGQETEQYNLMLNGDELPDIITHGWGLPETFPGGPDKAIADEYFLDLTQLIKDNAPNYQHILDTNEVVRKAVTTDNGAVWNMCMVDLTAQPEWDGPTIRKDIFDKYGLEIPVTIDDWYTALKTLKEKAPADYPNFKYPLMVGTDGFGDFNSFLGSFNADNTFQLNEKGEVVFGPITDNYKAAVENMAKWYAEGLIQEDYSVWNDFSKEFQNAECAAATYVGFWNFDSWTEAGKAIDPNYEMLGVAYPKLTADGEIPHISYTQTQARGYATVVTADCKNPEKAVSYLDWFYSEEGSHLANWGVEGEDYTMVDGKEVYTDKIVRNAEGVDIATINFKYLYSHGAFLRDWTRENGSYGEEANACQVRWGTSADDKYMMPVTLSYTDEESSEFNNIMNDVNTYVNENTTAFITGKRSLTEWDDYVAQIKAMNIDAATAIEKASYERWLAR